MANFMSIPEAISILLLCHFTFPMAFSSSTKFLHFPASTSISPNSNSNNYNFTPLYTTSRYSLPSTAERRGYLCVKCNGGPEMPQQRKDDDDNDNDETLKRVRKLYEVVKDKNLTKLSDVVADECPDVYNSIPLLRIFRAKLKVMEFFSHLTKTFGNNLKFTAKPMTKHGSMVGIKWKLGWDKTLMTLGRVNIHSYHSYVGKLLIGNLESIMDPFVQPKPMRLMDLNLEPKQRRLASLYLGFFLFVLSLFFFQFSVR